MRCLGVKSDEALELQLGVSAACCGTTNQGGCEGKGVKHSTQAAVCAVKAPMILVKLAKLRGFPELGEPLVA